MASHFNPQILADKLTKLNMSQQSIETLSYWCIFHMNKAKQVVETWDKQFHCSPREQRLAFLYLANDILQNSRRKGVEFVTEFWKVLPGSLRDVIKNGDESGKKAALRLVSIWEERKVFGSRGQLLKEEFLKEQSHNDSRSLRQGEFKLRPPASSALEKLVSGYEAVYGSQLDDDTIFNKCRYAMSFIAKLDKGADNDYKLVSNVNGSMTDELKGHHAVLKDCLQHLTTIESSRANLVNLLRDALQEQEHKLDQIHNQLEAVQLHSEKADQICSQLVVEHNDNGVPASQAPQTFTTQEQSSMIFKRQASVPEKPNSHTGEDPKLSAAAMAAKLTASTSSANMLTYVLSSLASEGVIGNSSNQSSNDYPPEKRVKLEKDHPSYVPPEIPAPPSEDPNPDEPPPPPSSPPPPFPPQPPPQQPFQVPQFVPASVFPHGYTVVHGPPDLGPGYAPGQFVPAAPNGVSAYAPAPQQEYYLSYPTEGGFYG